MPRFTVLDRDGATSLRALVIADDAPPPLTELRAVRQLGDAVSTTNAPDFVAEADPMPTSSSTPIRPTHLPHGFSMRG